MVLDNARDTEHVVPLLPGGSSYSVLITSRHELGGLIITHGGTTLPLRTLDEPQARELLAHKLGEARLAEEPDAAQQIVRQRGGISLALAIVGAGGSPARPAAVDAGRRTVGKPAGCPRHR
ncbi:hypothetical protein ACFVYA_21650 [Amycolatopsis sp. NPDC058278]|uniref:hypothetical protein n=1 Tax=Amycolatopsis sp. NPDC058278 TaxID=3346417 RepID=UPI0036DAAD8D